MNFTAEQFQAGVQRLYFDIDKCISDLVKARLSHDEYAEGKALFTMEHLLVATQQELACVNDFLFDLLQEKNDRQNQNNTKSRDARSQAAHSCNF